RARPARARRVRRDHRRGAGRGAPQRGADRRQAARVAQAPPAGARRAAARGADRTPLPEVPQARSLRRAASVIYELALISVMIGAGYWGWFFVKQRPYGTATFGIMQ